MRIKTKLFRYVFLFISIFLICSCTGKTAGQTAVLPTEMQSLPEASISIKTPMPTGVPSVSDTPKPTEIIIPSEILEPTEAPAASEAPKPMDTLIPSGIPKPTETPVPSEISKPMETPVPSEIPKPTEAPVPSEIPKPTETPAPSEIPKPTKTPAPSETPRPTETPKPVSNTVTISIYCVDSYILEETEVEWTKNQTVFDVLKQVTRDNKIHMDFTGRGSTAYITGINNVYEFDRGPESGWIYFVNGEYISKSAGAYQLTEGAVIQWKYTEKLGDLQG